VGPYIVVARSGGFFTLERRMMKRVTLGLVYLASVLYGGQAGVLSPPQVGIQKG